MQNFIFSDFNEPDIVRFLQQSNAIEGVYDLESLGNALIAWGYLSKVKTLKAVDVLTVHRLLMKNHLSGKELGHWRTEDVEVGGRNGTHWQYVPNVMAQWIEDIKTDRSTAERNKHNHIGFEQIHPFIDGNGRTGRMLYLWQAIHDQIPFEFMKENDRAEYYAWFK